MASLYSRTNYNRVVEAKKSESTWRVEICARKMKLKGCKGYVQYYFTETATCTVLSNGTKDMPENK